MSAEQKTNIENMQAAQEEVVRVSVRGLVEFILRSGDIDNRTGGLRDTEAMQLGSRLHRRIQAGMGDGYRAEVPLSMDFPCSMEETKVQTVEPEQPGQGGERSEQDEEQPGQGGARFEQDEEQSGRGGGQPETFYIRLEGRADGLVAETPEESALIDEIKGILRPVELLEEPVPVHLAQAKCYAYIYAAQRGLPEIRVRMTYASLIRPERGRRTSGKGGQVSRGEQLRFFNYTYAFEELEEWFFSVLNEYKKWARFERRWKQTRTAAIRQTVFPYPYREGQQELMRDVYRTILRGKQLFIQAPTGVGKTLSCVFPAVKAMGEGKAERIFYLTARTITRTAAEGAFALLRENGLRMKTIVLTAKEKICPLEKMSCEPDSCPYAEGHFDRINDAVFALITSRDSFSREDILAAAEQYRVCPYELALDIASWMDAVIGDYNYVFHPRSKLKRFFGEGVKGDYIFLVDEAHNLVDRGRDMYSASLVREDILAIRRQAKGKVPELVTSAKKLATALAHLKKELEESEQPYQIREMPAGLPEKVLNLFGTLEQLFKDVRDGDVRVEEELMDAALELYFDMGRFLDTLELLDENYVIYTESLSGKRFRLRLLCVKPSANLQSCFEKGRASILFSATMLPIDYYRAMLGTPESYAVYARSCFLPERLKILMGTDISTRYTSRTTLTYSRIAEYILRMVSAHPGNYMVFFPSYKMLEDTQEYFRLICPADVRLLCQTPGMEEGEREAFLESFRGDEAQTSAAGTAHFVASVASADSADSAYISAAMDNVDGAGATDAADMIDTAANAIDTAADVIDGADVADAADVRQDFRSSAAAGRAASLIGFCVMGSIFGEGIDLRGERLIGAAIVGPGLPMVCAEQEILRGWFDSHGQDGFRLAYQCPGMNKVQQAAGRVIRTETDRGTVLLLDERFSQASYRQMFPREWAGAAYCRIGNVAETLQGFWERMDQMDDEVILQGQPDPEG